jgi:hypothetical protein
MNINRHMLWAIILIAIGIIVPTIVFASFGSSSSFGGRVTQTSIPNVTCSGAIGPLMISPAGGPDGPYIIQSSTGHTPTIGGYILGTYSTVKDTTTCKQGKDTSYPVYVITLYGAS